MKLEGKTLAITGAGGFIGGRLATRAGEAGMRVRGLDRVPTMSRAVHEQLVGDMCDPAVARALVRGADVVVHTAAAVGEGGDFPAFRKLNVDATQQIGELCVQERVSTLVHFSSVMVYGYSFPPWVTEDGPQRGEGDAYCQTKIESEGVLRPLRAQVRTVVIRPGDVYGPGSAHWVVRPLEAIRRGLFALPRGYGIMNHVYVDNLVDAVLLAIENDAVEGAFNVTDGAATTFKVYFDAIARMAGKSGVPVVPASVMRAVLAFRKQRSLRRGEVPEGDPSTVSYLSRPHPYSVERAKNVLGYAPKVLLEEGMARTREWLVARGG